jgi:hypothetical protein
MACVVRRGRIHVCGVFAAISCAYGKPQVMVTKWMKSNLEWWSAFFSAGAAPVSMLVRPPTAQFIPTTDASGKGYGGVFMGEGETIKTVYYFYGEWSAEV